MRVEVRFNFRPLRNWILWIDSKARLALWLLLADISVSHNIQDTRLFRHSKHACTYISIQQIAFVTSRWYISSAYIGSIQTGNIGQSWLQIEFSNVFHKVQCGFHIPRSVGFAKQCTSLYNIFNMSTWLMSHVTNIFLMIFEWSIDLNVPLISSYVIYQWMTLLRS